MQELRHVDGHFGEDRRRFHIKPLVRRRVREYGPAGRGEHRGVHRAHSADPRDAPDGRSHASFRLAPHVEMGGAGLETFRPKPCHFSCHPDPEPSK
jgi:hypothetical protein